MQKSIERLDGDTEGVTYELTVLRFTGGKAGAPRAYLQAALHGGEMPGVAAINALAPMLRKAEAEGRILGDITVVPWANPVGRGQYQFGDLQGRFHTGTRTNFNRDFPLVARPDPALLPKEDGLENVDERLKVRLLSLSLGHDIILDLHCDDEGVSYLYVPSALWPAMEDCAAAMGVDAVVTWAGGSGASFDEASVHPHLESGSDTNRVVATTVEFRGVADVDRALGESDAAGLYRLLVGRGVIADDSVAAPGRFKGVAAPIEHVDMIDAPVAGVILFDVKPGDRVAAGDRVATILRAPGEEGGAVDVFAPQGGYVFTRRSSRQTRRGENLIKLLGDAPSAVKKSGALED